MPARNATSRPATDQRGSPGFRTRVGARIGRSRSRRHRPRWSCQPELARPKPCYRFLSPPAARACLSSSRPSPQDADRREVPDSWRAKDAGRKDSGRRVAPTHRYACCDTFRATQSMSWPGIAGVDVALVHIYKGQRSGAAFLADKRVETISSDLERLSGFRVFVNGRVDVRRIWVEKWLLCLKGGFLARTFVGMVLLERRGTHRRCPRCGTEGKLRRSRLRFWEGLMRLTSARRPFRCGVCRARAWFGPWRERRGRHR